MMKNKNIILLIALFAILTLSLTACSENSPSAPESTEQTTTESKPRNQTDPRRAKNIEVLSEISIDTKEDDLQAIADKHRYHLDLTRYNAGTSNRAPEENYVYELYDPHQFSSETAEEYRRNGTYDTVRVTYYHANDEEDTKYIVSSAYSEGGSDLIKHCYPNPSGEIDYGSDD